MAKRLLRFVALLLLLTIPVNQAAAQFGGFGGMMGGGMMGGGFGGGMMGGGFGGGMMGGGFGGMMMGGMGGGMMMGMMAGGGGAGVNIDADGVLKDVDRDPTGALTRKAFAAAKEMTKEYERSDFRKVSLNRLEKAIKARFDEKKNLTAEMAYLAGLTRVRYVMLLPETNDIILAGPAEPAFMDADGEVRGIDSMKPCVQLQDVVAAMRAYPPGGRYTYHIGCSIDPTAEGLARMQQFIAQISRRGAPRSAKIIVNGLREAMGKQNITITGVSPESHFAQVMVAADYRMKLIGIGVEKPPVRIPSYVDLSRGGSKNALVRWYFMPEYKSVVMSDDHLAIELVGDGVKLVGADEVVTAGGERLSSTPSDGASKRFTEAFTTNYPELAAKVPVYANLRNLIDVAVAAAYMQKEDLYGKSGHHFELFMNEEDFAIEFFHAPKQVDTVVTAVWKGSKLMTPMGGGVHIEPRQALEQDNLLTDEEGKLAGRRAGLDVKKLEGERWWWD
ncbi:MAG: DUF1598 domain-containing protein [Pirellulaceae bacterium]